MNAETRAPEAEATVDPRRLRNAFGTFATGVTVVTCRTPDGTAHGATVNAFTAVSLDPPLAQVTLIRKNKAAQYLEDQPFAINVMADDQLDVCLNFAGKPMSTPVQWRPDGPERVPVLDGNAATIECRPWKVYDGGDHVIVIGEVVEVELTDKKPLVFFRGKFRQMGPFCGGTPWEGSGDAPSSGWFEGTTTFLSLD